MKRRKFLIGAGGGWLAATGIRPGERTWRAIGRRGKAPAPLASARNFIFVFLSGGPSHVDTFDLKPGPHTPDFLGVQTLDAGGYWPAGSLPNLAERLDRIALLRSVTAVEAVHTRAFYHLFTSHRENPAMAAEIPHFGATLSYFFEEQRRETDILPTFVSTLPAHNGFFPAIHRGLRLSRDTTIENLTHDRDGEPDRFELLAQLWHAVEGPSGEKRDRLEFQKKARGMMAEEVSRLFEGRPLVVNNPRLSFLRQCDLAIKLFDADLGTRIFQMQLPLWDHHIDIYNSVDQGALYQLSLTLDQGLTHLIDELGTRPGSSGEGSLLDETLIVAMGEFGRTVGGLNRSRGRDHFPYAMAALFAGGGVKGGRVVGGTDEIGGAIVDPGWSHPRFMGLSDVWATIYSALGIDWTLRFLDTPSGRPFELVESNYGPSLAIDELFV